MEFVDTLEKVTNAKLTENFALAQDSSSNALVDLFSVLGALRPRDKEEIADKFRRAFSVDKELATKMIFYTRDIRGGLGERRTARVMLEELANTKPEIVIENMKLIPFFGRWDDLFVLFDTPCEKEMINYVLTTLNEDMEAEDYALTLLAKWMPSINTSSKETVKMAKRFANEFGWTEANYRRRIARLRKRLRVVERFMSSNNWEQINYENVPSNAMNLYCNAFYRRDTERFNSYLEDVRAGVKIIHSGTLYPYNIVQKILHGDKNKVLEEQWKALPNYVEGDDNYLVMADVSGSMKCDNALPMATSIGLAIYFAERNKGAFANKYMTFSETPKIVSAKGNNIFEKVNIIKKSCIGFSTNLEKAFEAILTAAKVSNCSQDEIPSSLIVITDMEIDCYVIEGSSFTFLDEMKHRFEQEGYKLPNVVFWNVHARHDTFHAFADDTRVQLVSGHSTSTFKLLMDSFNYTLYETMIKALNNERYDCVKV